MPTTLLWTRRIRKLCRIGTQQSVERDSQPNLWKMSRVCEAPVAGESAPKSACAEYDKECAESADTDLYACGAGNCCRAFGSNSLANCVRGCLLKHNQSCRSWPIMKNQCREASHIGCWIQCGQPTTPWSECIQPLSNGLFNFR